MKQSRNNLFYLFSILYIVVICLWSISSINVVESATVNTNGGSTSDTNCPYQALPDTLNDFNFLGFNGEFHLHETFYYDFKNFQKSITFTLTQKSAFRIYVAPHVVDVDLWLYAVGNTKAITHTSDMGGDENLYAELEAGDYNLKFLFFGQNKASKLDCPTLSLEIAIAPTATMQNRLSNFQCPNQQILPTPSFSGLATSGKYVYDSDVDQVGTILNVIDTDIYNEAYKFFQAIPFTLPPSNIANKYGVDISLGFDFLTGGSLNIIVQSADLGEPSNIQCVKSGNCTMGTHTSKGHSIIKTVLLPGEYNIWIYDQTMEKDSAIQPDCVPFSMFIDIAPAHQVEDFLNCPQFFLPSSFNDPGYLDDGGFMYLDEDVYIDVTVKSVTIGFNLTQDKSYFRAYVPDFRVDIDLNLSQYSDDGSSKVISRSFKFGGEEEINAQLSAGRYSLTIYYFGKNADIFCDAYPLEVAIAPIDDYHSGCIGTTNPSEITPPIDQINTTLYNNNGVYELNADPNQPMAIYQHLYNGKTQVTNITMATFTVPEGSVYFFESILESSFIVSDIRLVLNDLAMDQDESNILYVGTHDRNRHIINLRLYPGDYSIIIQTPSISNGQTAYIPTCWSYTLSIVIKPVGDKSYDSTCWGLAEELPSDLNSPAYLGSSDRLHVSGEYLIPSLPMFSSASTYHNFTVRVASVLRVYTQYNKVDIDLNLKENGTLVAWNTHFYSEEAMVYQLKVGSVYQLRIKYFHLGISSIPDCSTFNLEMSIAPINENPNDSCGKNLKLIPTNLIPTPTSTPWFSSDVYNFNQNSSSISFKLPFTVPASANVAEFRAVLSYDFIWNNLAVALSSSTGSNVITDGILGYNRHEIEPTELVPGDYELAIYEPFPNSDTKLSLRNCVDFMLEVGIQIKEETDLDKDTVVCPVLMFPNNFNSIGYMSNLTSQSLYFIETVLADVVNGKDTVSFSLSSNSIVRIYVPPNPDMQINIELFMNGQSIAKGNKDDIIFAECVPNKYQIKFTYYGLGGPIPKIEDCPSFDVFVSIAQSSDIVTGAITQQCPADTVSFPTNIIGNAPFTGNFHRSMSIQSFSQQLTFKSDNYTHFYANLDYNDLIASLSMKLEGNITFKGTVIQETYQALYQGGESFINLVIPPGTYRLTIYDPAVSNPSVSIQCAQYSFSYFLNSTNGVAPTCDSSMVLPRDLSSVGQTSTGEVRYSASHLLIPSSKVASRISFINPTTTSYMRVMAQAEAGNDIDFFIYPNATATDPIYSSIIALTTDNNVWKLNPQSVPYVFEIRYFKLNKRTNCNYFSLDIAISNLASIQAELLCPSQMPNELSQVPPEQINFPFGEDVQIGSGQNYFFSASRVRDNTDKKGIFTYTMTLNVVGSTVLYANLGFDFLANDLNMKLSNVSSTGIVSPLAFGVDSIPLNTDTDVDIYNIINYQLDPGTYRLQITEDVKYNSFGIENSCHYFSFSLTGTSLSSGTKPRIVSVSPPGLTNAAVTSDLSLSITFSEQYALPAGGNTLLEYIQDSQAMYLQSQAPDKKILLPIQAINIKFTKIMITFDKDDLVSGVSYQFIMDSTKFIQANNGSARFSPEETTTKHMYSFRGCECSGHGQCGSNGVSCVCNDPWAGIDCSRCKVGYHGVGTECVVNVPCNSTSCNGHGKCTATNGFPECECNLGYNSVSGAFCGSCAYGYQGYPNCKLIPDNEPTYCYAPIIPGSLNTIEYLGFENRTHIQDNYYLDITAGGHDTQFTIHETSMLRVYTEPHQFDVDLWLYNATDDWDMVDTVDRSITFNHEEVILVILSPGNYILSFKYYNWGKIKANCPTFNLELAIDTLSDMQYNFNQIKDICLNGADKGNAPSTDVIPKVISSTYSYDKPNVLYLFTNIKPSKNLVYLYNTTFTIKPEQADKIALADIEISYQFLPGDLSMVIQSGNSTTVTCKGSTDATIAGCIYGDNELNRNVIHATLAAGTYTLFIYAPEFSDASFMTCTPFNMKTSFSFINDDEDYFNCDGEILPKSLNNAEFIQNNYLHVQDLYLIDSKHSNISFSVTENCFIRVNAQQDSAIVQISLINSLNQVLGKNTALIYVRIAPGDYVLTIETNRIANAKNFCPTINLEIAIEPLDTPTIWATDCPNSEVQTSLPIFNIQTIPFIFENGTTHKKIYTVDYNSPAVVGGYSFKVTQTTQFYAAIASQFLHGDLRVNLYKKLDDPKKSTMLFIVGNHDYNYNWIQENIEAGQYVLKIERPPISLGVYNTVKCIPFEFEFVLLPLSNSEVCPGESIPLSWNTVRFLGTEGKFHYQSDNFVVPKGKYTHVEIPIMVQDASVLRLYVNPHIVDIDIRLKDPFTNNTVISGSNLINTEESFVYLLPQNSTFYVQLQFWKWSSNIPTCNTFSLEIALAPVKDISVTTCPNKGDNWPTIPSTFQNDQYSYSSLDSGADYWFQQANSGAGLKSKTYTFTTKVGSNLHTQVGYDFLTGDLAIKLVSNAKNKKVYYGVNAPNRYILEIVNLPPGTYNLIIYEPFSSLDSIMGCSHFNFDFYIENSINFDQEDGFYHYLPSTLDTFAYLNYNLATHIQGEYMMFDGNPAHNKLSFTITSKSFIRVQATFLASDEVNSYNETSNPIVSIRTPIDDKPIDSLNRISSIFGLLEPGQYYLQITQGLRVASNIAVDLELAINTVEQVQKAINSIDQSPDCENSQSIVIVPSANDGSFYFSEQLNAAYIKMKQPGVVLQSEFTITQPTLVYAQVGYQFVLGDLNLLITSDDRHTITLEGRANRNTNEINVILPPGTYLISVINPVAIVEDFGPHCTPYHLSFTLRNASTSAHSDCSLFNAIPWDLNDKNGGTAEFGGPIDGEGNLRLYSDDFIAPYTKSTQNMTFTVSESTFVNIFTVDDLSATIDTDIYAHNSNDDQDLLYSIPLHNNAQHSSLFVASVPSSKANKQFDITLDFNGVSKGSCPLFGMQVVMKPVSYLTNQLLCPKGFLSTLPSVDVTTNSFGAYNEYISSRMSGDFINSKTVGTANSQFEYYIDFNINAVSRIDASFSFDSIATNFILKLTTKVVDSKTGKITRNVIGQGDWNAEAAYGETTMTSSISSASLSVGNYSIIITQPKYQANQYITASLYSELCFPFTYSLTIMNRDQAYAGSVSPSNGFNILPTRDLSLILSTRSALYDSNGDKLTCDSVSYVKSAVYLASSTSSDKVKPTSVVCLSTDGSKWSLTFSNQTLVSDNTYILSLENGKLFDSKARPSILPPQHVYSMLDTSCSNNGQFVDSVCKCATQYSGVDCYNCAQGYHNIPGQSGQPVCVSTTCSTNYCGCDPNNNATCTQLGQCYIDPSTSNAMCKCSTPYAGATCNTCNQGYRNWPYCTVYKDCGDCGKGSCNHDNGQCQCPVNYQGENCKECADGYSGSDCKKNGSSAIIALEVIGSLVAASILIGVGIWYVRTRYRSGVARYKMLPKFDFDHDDERTTQFPGLYDDEDNTNDPFGGGNKNDKSINRSGGKTHVFSFSSMPSSAVDSDDDDEDYKQQQKIQAQNQKNNHLFDM